MKKNMLKAAYLLAPLVASLSALSIMPTSVTAQTASRSPVSLTSDVKIERVETDASGAEKVRLYTANDVSVVPGDRVLFTLEVFNSGTEPASGFRATNPIPAPVRFTSVSESWAEVSVDGGTNWGKLADLKVKANDTAGVSQVERAAGPEDVTHVRWVFPDAIAAGAKRTISYRGVVK